MMSGNERVKARGIRRNVTAFYVLASAFVISAVYQIYRASLMEIPEIDAFTPTMGVFYLACIGVSALVLTDRRWAWWVVSILIVVLLAVGVLYYYPVVAEAREMGFIDWLEGSVYMELLFVAGFVCALEILGVDFAPSEKNHSFE